MKKVVFLFLLSIFFSFSQSSVFAQSNVAKLRNVKTIYLDEESFNFKSSSCMKIIGNLKVVCTKHLNNRKEFLAALKTWVEKYKFTLVSDKADADAILQGDLSIDDDYTLREFNERKRNRKDNRKDGRELSPSGFDPDYLPGEPVWEVNSWLVNQNGVKIWTKGGWYPEPSFGWSSPSKIQAKKLAKELQYDFKKSK